MTVQKYILFTPKHLQG